MWGSAPRSPVALRRGRKPLYRVSFCLAFSLRVLLAKKKRRTISNGNRPVILKFRSSLAGKTRSRISRVLHRRERTSPEVFIKFRSSLFKGLRFPKAEPLVALRRGRKPLYRVSFCLAFSLRVLLAKKKHRTISNGNRPVN